MEAAEEEKEEEEAEPEREWDHKIPNLDLKVKTSSSISRRPLLTVNVDQTMYGGE